MEENACMKGYKMIGPTRLPQKKSRHNQKEYEHFLRSQTEKEINKQIKTGGKSVFGIKG